MPDKGKSKELRALKPEEYTVGWICALDTELTSAKAMLDEKHRKLEDQPQHDGNSYTLGSMEGHNVVIAILPEYGTVNAAVVATSMYNTFQNLRFCLMVGVGGGIPSVKAIRLGDIVVSSPEGQGGGVIQYDLGRMELGEFRRVGSLNKPPTRLRTAVKDLRSEFGLAAEISSMVDEIFGEVDDDENEWTYPSRSKDVLFKDDFDHIGGNPDCTLCSSDPIRIVERKPRSTKNPRIFYGNIASGNMVIKNPIFRDNLAKRDDVICFEMEAAGLMDNFPCLVIRGISDYADSHKNWAWQPYAAAVAASYGKKLLSVVTPQQVRQMNPIFKNEHWLIPRQVNPNFTGREIILSTLRDKLCGANDRRRSFMIYGMGGAGKSEVCLKFAHDNRNKFWGVFWVDCGSEANIKSGYIKAAATANGGDEKSYEWSKSWLENCKESWLLILDNADNMGDPKNPVNSRRTEDVVIDYSKFIPSGDRGSILLTSRNEECKIYGQDGSHNFEKLELSDSITLLLRSAKLKDNEGNCHHAMAIVGDSCLTQHPLAIVQAGAFIRQRLCSLQDYPAEFKRQRAVLLRHRPSQADSCYGDVYTAFEVSAKAMESGTLPEYAVALELLKILAFFDRRDVGENIFVRAWDLAMAIEEGRYTTEEPNADLKYPSMWHVNKLKNVLCQPTSQNLDLTSFRKALSVLQSFSLITVHPESGSISMHPLVHAWAKDRLATEVQHKVWASAASVLALSIDSFDYQEYFRLLHPHILFCIGSTPDEELNHAAQNGHALGVCKIFFRFAWLLYRHGGEDALSEKVAHLVVSRVGIEIPPKSEDWRHGSYLLACCQQRNDNYQGSMELLREIVLHDEETGRRHPTHPVRLAALSALAGAYQDLGQTKEAIDLYKGILRARESTCVEGDEYLLYDQYLLGRAYVVDNQIEKGIELLEKAVTTGRQAILPPTHPRVLGSQHELARTYLKKNQVQDAIQLLEIVIAKRKETLHSTHPDLLTSQHNLAGAYLENNQLQDSIQLLETVVLKRKETLHSTHPDLLTSQQVLALAYLKNNQIQDSVSLLEIVVSKRKETLHSTHPNLLTSQYWLAEAYGANTQFQDAIELLKEVVTRCKEALHATHPDLLESQHNLAIAYSNNNQFAEAVQLGEVVVAMRSEILPPDDKSHLDSQHNLACNYYGIGEYHTALQILQHVVNIRCDISDPNDIDRIKSERLLSMCEEAIERRSPPETVR